MLGEEGSRQRNEKVWYLAWEESMTASYCEDWEIIIKGYGNWSRAYKLNAEGKANK